MDEETICFFCFKPIAADECRRKLSWMGTSYIHADCHQGTLQYLLRNDPEFLSYVSQYITEDLEHFGYKRYGLELIEPEMEA